MRCIPSPRGCIPILLIPSPFIPFSEDKKGIGMENRRGMHPFWKLGTILVEKKGKGKKGGSPPFP
jgi:hypothetical protein